MQIDDKLNLAFPLRWQSVERPDPKDATKTITVSEPLVWAYHTPISKEIFTANYRIIAATNATIWGEGLKYAATAGTRIANFTLLEKSKKDAEEFGTSDVGPQFLAELKRLTLVLAAGPNGFDLIPVDAAIGREVIDRDDWEEAEAELVFFTVGFAMSRKAGRKIFCEGISSVFGGSITSSSATEFAASLRTSTPSVITAPSDTLLVPS